MVKKIVTHPDNIVLVKELFKEEFEKEKKENCGFIHYINPFPNIQLVSNSYMEKYRAKWTGRWRIKENRFYTYWDGKGEPPSWCVFFGFVEKEMEQILNFVEIDDFSTCLGKRMFFDNPIKIDNRPFLISNYC